MNRIRATHLIACLALGCTPPTHQAVVRLGDCVDPPHGVDAPARRECTDAPSHIGGAWADCIAAIHEARPNEPCIFDEGGFCGDAAANVASVTCIGGRILAYDGMEAPPGECTPTETAVVGSCLVTGCVSVCPREPVPPTDTSVTWNVDDEASCRALLAEVPEAGTPCTGERWCQGFHYYETDPTGGYEVDPIVAFCGDQGLAIIQHGEIPGQPFYQLL